MTIFMGARAVAKRPALFLIKNFNIIG